MKTIHLALTAVAVAMLLPPAAYAQKVSYDIGSADLGGLKTFAFRDAPEENKTERTTGYDSPLVKERTYAAIAVQLEARGLRQDNDHPDLYVTARRTFKTETTVYSNDWGPGYGYGWGWGWGWGPYYT